MPPSKKQLKFRQDKSTIAMTKKLKMWNSYDSWEDAEKAWEEGAQTCAKRFPIKRLKTLPSMPGITDKTARNLKWKAFKWLVREDHSGQIKKGFFRRPIKYGISYVKSLLKRESYVRDGDFFLYGLKTLDDFRGLLEDPEKIFVIGFSYCHKPFECPSGRFSAECIHDPEHPVCRQCFIGKTVHSLPEYNTVCLFIPTVHYIGEKIFEIVHRNPSKEVVFLITACEMTLKMFGDWGNMVGIKGAGVRLGGRICNTMKAFQLSEKGIKPGLTVVMDDTKKTLLELIKHRRKFLQD